MHYFFKTCLVSVLPCNQIIYFRNRHFVAPFNTLAETTIRRMQLNNELSHNSTQVVFAAINCAEFSATCSKGNITSYPTIQFYNRGKRQGIVDYDCSNS